RLLALPDDLLDLLADRLEGDTERLQRLGGDALTLVDEAEQDVLGPDVVVVEEPRLFLREDHDPSGSVGEALEQDSASREVLRRPHAPPAPEAADLPEPSDGEAGGCRLVHHSIGRSARFFGDRTAPKVPYSAET